MPLGTMNGLSLISTVTLPPEALREPGDYYVEAFAAGESCATRRIRVFPSPEPPRGCRETGTDATGSEGDRPGADA